MEPHTYFSDRSIVNKKRYDALRAFFYENCPADEVARAYGYSLSSLYSLTRDFRKYLKQNPEGDFFFKNITLGRKGKKNGDLEDIIINLRKHNFSAKDIVGIVNSKGYKVSYGYVYKLLNNEGFARLPRRSRPEVKRLELPEIKAPKAGTIKIKYEKFHSGTTGIFAMLPVIRKYGIDKIISGSFYPGTKDINKLSSILSFLALKLSKIKHFSDDNIWNMDRGMGLFAGLNVLPGSSWFASYSGNVTYDMNLNFMKSLQDTWVKHGLLSDTCNLDLTSVPCWQDYKYLDVNGIENKNKAISSMRVVLAQDPESGIIDYGSNGLINENQSAVALEYLNFSKQTITGKHKINYLVFDSKFTNYENLSKLDDGAIKFISIRRRGKNILEQANKNKNCQTLRLKTSGMRKRTIKVYDEYITLRGYRDENTKTLKQIRQITILESCKAKPALIITNDFDLSTNAVIRKYCKREIVEKGISWQTEFFNFKRVSSQMVIKVDFDLIMTILAHNIYMLFARELGNYCEISDDRIYEKFIANNGFIEIKESRIKIELKRKKESPQLIEMMKNFSDINYQWLDNMKIVFCPSSST